MSRAILLTTINSKYIHQNLAIRLLYELNRNHQGLDIKEFSPINSTGEIVSFCIQYNVVAFSCYIWNIVQILEVSLKIKQLNPDCKILLGGPEVSYDWNKIIALPQIDFIILGEGETPFTLFLKSYPDIDLVPSLIWIKDGEIFENKAPEVFNLEQLQNINPYKSIPDEELQHKVCYIEASRGCPNRCGFCLAGIHSQIRYLPQETIQANLLYLMEKARVIKFLDRTFNNHPAFAISIFQFILKHYRPGNVFQFEIKADKLQTDFLEFIKVHVPKGVFRFEIGIQTLNSKSNKEVGRKQNFDNIKTFVRQVSDKVVIHLDLIVGLPFDYWADIKHSFEEVFKLFAPELQLGFLKFLKGTPVRENYVEHDFQFDPSPPYQIIKSKYLSQAELEGIELVEHALDICWNKKRALQTLRYVALNYSIFDFLFCLGRYWKNKNGFRNTGLTDVYTTLHEFSMQHYSSTLVPELVALDYYMQHKVKPGIRFLPEISKDAKNEISEQFKLNRHKFRYAMHPVNFSVSKLVNYGIVEPSVDLLIIEYTGVGTPRILLP